MIFGYLSEWNIASVVFRILLSALLGGIVGYERGRHGRAAGFRTHVLVCVGSALAGMTGIYMTVAGMGDPSRIASGVVSGIGFIGAGMILVKNNSKVMGLTTAAGLWATGAIGLAVGAGFFIGGLVGLAVVFVTTAFLTVLEVRQKKDLRFYLEVDDPREVNAVCAAVRALYPQSHSFDVESAKSGIAGNVGVSVNITADKEPPARISEKILENEHVVMCIDA